MKSRSSYNDAHQVGIALAAVAVFLIALFAMRRGAELVLGQGDAALILTYALITPICCYAFYRLPSPHARREQRTAKSTGIMISVIAGIFLAFFTWLVSAPLGVSHAVDATLTGALCVGFLAPIAEEAVFRGIALGSLEHVFGKTWAVVTSAALFACAHFDGQQPLTLPLAFCAGLVFGAVFLVNHSIIEATVSHCVANTVPFLLAPFTHSILSGFIC